MNRCTEENLAGFQLDAASSSCGALCLPRWDLGNYYTVGGSGRVIPKDPVPVSQCLKCRWPPMATFFDISRVMATFQRVSAICIDFCAPGMGWLIKIAAGPSWKASRMPASSQTARCIRICPMMRRCLPQFTGTCFHRGSYRTCFTSLSDRKVLEKGECILELIKMN